MDLIYPRILSLAYENAVPNIPETSLQIGDFVKVVLGASKISMQLSLEGAMGMR